MFVFFYLKKKFIRLQFDFDLNCLKTFYLFVVRLLRLHKVCRQNRRLFFSHFDDAAKAFQNYRRLSLDLSVFLIAGSVSIFLAGFGCIS